MWRGEGFVEREEGRGRGGEEKEKGKERRKTRRGEMEG